MDFLTKKELDGFKGDVKASQIAIEADKYTFQRKLINELGPEMMNELNKPKSKPTVQKKTGFLKRLFKRKGD